MSETLTAAFTRQYEGGSTIRVENFCFPMEGGTTVLFGPSGCGKSTVLRCLAGLDRPDAGTIRCGETLWFDASRRVQIAARERHVGYVPQEYALFPHLTAAENVAYGLQGMDRHRIAARIDETLEWLGIEDCRRRRPSELSGGQRQRVALARAIAPQPRLLLFDEPLSALDAPTRQRLRGELGAWLTRVNTATLLVTHDRTEALALGDRVAVMDSGRILQCGTVHETFTRPASPVVAALVGVETIVPGRITGVLADLATVRVGTATLIAVATELPCGATNVCVCIRAEDVMLSLHQDAASSSRNRLPATVLRMTPEGPMVRIELNCGFALTALLTKQACEEMALKRDLRVFAMIKAPQVHLVPRSTPLATA